MKKFFLLVGSVGLLGILGGCSDLGPDSGATQEEQFNRAGTGPGLPPTDSLGNPEETPLKPVPGE